MAQATEAEIPNASQLILIFMPQIYSIAQFLATLLQIVQSLPLCFNAFSMKKRWAIYLLFFVILALGFYFTMGRLIPGYTTVKLPVLSYVQPFRFINQDGKPITEKDLEGKVFVTEYFFTTCPNICPMLNSNMRKVYDAYKDAPDFLVVSHTCDPDRDSATQLRHYADSMQVDTKKWWFLTGRKDSLYQAARTSYLLDDPKNSLQNIDDQFMHTQFFALVDRNGQVRKIYDGLKEQEVQLLINDIRDVLAEEITKARFRNNLFAN